MSSFEACTMEDFVAEVTPQVGSLEEAASAQEILIQQVEGYLQRLKAAICADLDSLAGGGGVSTFLGLTDTPASYVGEAAKVATVNGGETALEFVTPGGLPNLVDNVEISSGRQVAGNDTFFKLRDIGALPNTTTKLVAHNIGAAFAVVHAYGAGNDPVVPNSVPVIFATTSAATNTIWFFTDATNLNIVAGTNRSNFSNSFIVLEYYYL